MTAITVTTASMIRVMTSAIPWHDVADRADR
jgi:hypothetical protein